MPKRGSTQSWMRARPRSSGPHTAPTGVPGRRSRSYGPGCGQTGEINCLNREVRVDSDIEFCGRSGTPVSVNSGRNPGSRGFEVPGS